MALQTILVGEAKRSFESWKLEGLPYEKLLAKLKDYGRGRRLDGEAKAGKQAVDLSGFQSPAAKWEEEEWAEEEATEADVESVNAVNAAKCYVCGQKGTHCPKLSEEEGGQGG